MYTKVSPKRPNISHWKLLQVNKMAQGGKLMPILYIFIKATKSKLMSVKALVSFIALFIVIH